MKSYLVEINLKSSTKANLTNVLQAEDGWGDPSLATFIEDSIH